MADGLRRGLGTPPDATAAAHQHRGLSGHTAGRSPAVPWLRARDQPDKRSLRERLGSLRSGPGPLRSDPARAPRAAHVAVASPARHHPRRRHERHPARDHPAPGRTVETPAEVLAAHGHRTAAFTDGGWVAPRSDIHDPYPTTEHFSRVFTDLTHAELSQKLGHRPRSDRLPEHRRVGGPHHRAALGPRRGVSRSRRVRARAPGLPGAGPGAAAGPPAPQPTAAPRAHPDAVDRTPPPRRSRTAGGGDRCRDDGPRGPGRSAPVRPRCRIGDPTRGPMVPIPRLLFEWMKRKHVAPSRPQPPEIQCPARSCSCSH